MAFYGSARKAYLFPEWKHNVTECRYDGTFGWMHVRFSSLQHTKLDWETNGFIGFWYWSSGFWLSILHVVGMKLYSDLKTCKFPSLNALRA